MNYVYLMQHVSYHLHTIVRRYSYTQNLQDSFCGRVNFNDQPVIQQVDEYLFSNLMKQDSITEPGLFSVNQLIAYACIPTPESLYMLGPIKFQAPVYLKYQLEVPELSTEWLKIVPVCDFSEVTKDILLIYNLYSEEILDEISLLQQNFINPGTETEIRKYYSELVFENREEGRKHNPYDQEHREFSSIEQGDLESLKRSRAEDYTGEIGTLAKDPLRNAKNLGIVIITLASRAAIRGGLLAEIAFSMSDSYIQKIEAQSDITSVYHIFYSAEYEYAQMVRDIKEQQSGLKDKKINYHINRCKDYVFAHLHDRILVQDIADELGLNANYLSGLFHKCEKTSLTDFILQEKIKLAKNLLVYSQYTYIEIATYLGFASQSHLGKHFKKSTGMTLRQYRQTYGVSEFIH